jgi:hypothetical protein
VSKKRIVRCVASGKLRATSTVIWKNTVTDLSVSHSSEQQHSMELSPGKRLVNWIQEPLGSVIAASVTAMGSLGVVLSGAWFIHLALN